MNNSESGVYKLLVSLNQLKWSIIGKSLFCGVLAGLLAVLYRLLYERGIGIATKIYSYLRANPVMIFPWILTIAIIGLFIAWLIKWEPMATGGGIPQVKGVILYGLKMKWYSVLLVRFAGGFLSAACGLSLGREGPSKQIGAAAGLAVAKYTSKNKLEENYLITSGAAAGLSAAFNAPISGMLFALEEMHRSFSPLILIAAAVASLTADFAAKFFFGMTPFLNFPIVHQLPVDLYFWLIPLGLFSGLSGILINKSLVTFQTLFRKIPWFLRPFTALVIALFFGLFLPEVLGGGQNLIGLAQGAQQGIPILLLFLAAKVLFTSTSFGSGSPGGIFLPTLSIAALTGGTIGVIATHFGMPLIFVPIFVACSIAGTLSGAMRVPVTSILLAAELTGSFTLLLPIAACSFIAFLIADLLNVPPLYSTLLKRFIDQNENELKAQKKGSIFEVAVEYGSPAANKNLNEVEWPEGALIVTLKRDGKEIFPSGHTKILPGDYLMILSADDAIIDIRQSVKNLCCID